MPKKFRGGNPKAEAARERKAAVKQASEDQKRKEEDDAYWRDDDKHALRKQERKVSHWRRAPVSVTSIWKTWEGTMKVLGGKISTKFLTDSCPVTIRRVVSESCRHRNFVCNMHAITVTCIDNLVSEARRPH